jgi:hypothetical protein
MCLLRNAAKKHFSLLFIIRWSCFETIIGYGDFIFTLKKEGNFSKAKIYFRSPTKGVKT